MPEIPNYFHATALCKFYLRGTCTRGTQCTFAHGSSTLRSKPDLRNTKICQPFSLSGACGKGGACPFAHETNELRKKRSGPGLGKRQTRPMSGDAAVDFEIEKARLALRCTQAGHELTLRDFSSIHNDLDAMLVAMESRRVEHSQHSDVEECVRTEQMVALSNLPSGVPVLDAMLSCKKRHEGRYPTTSTVMSDQSAFDRQSTDDVLNYDWRAQLSGESDWFDDASVEAQGSLVPLAGTSTPSWTEVQDEIIICEGYGGDDVEVDCVIETKNTFIHVGPRRKAKKNRDLYKTI